jgi:hypothetical protein
VLATKLTCQTEEITRNLSLLIRASSSRAGVLLIRRNAAVRRTGRSSAKSCPCCDQPGPDTQEIRSRYFRAKLKRSANHWCFRWLPGRSEQFGHLAISFECRSALGNSTAASR